MIDNPLYNPYERSRIITESELLEAFGAAYTHEGNELKLVDFELGMALAAEIFPKDTNDCETAYL